MQWRVLDFQRFTGLIAAKTGQVFANNQAVPIIDVAVILIGVKCSVHASLYSVAAEYGVPILNCDWRGTPHSATLPWSSNTRVGARHIAQSELSEGRRKNAWKQIVKAKIKGQASNLDDSSGAFAALTRIANETKSGDPSNNEGQAARIYWGSIFKDEPDFSRNSNFNFGRNAMLNYGYTILRGHTIRSVVSAGLWPTLGIWHRNRANVFALADDMIEPFRPAIDSVVMKYSNNDSPLNEPEIKTALVAAVEQQFLKDGSSVTTALDKLCSHFGQYVEGECDKLAVSCWHGAPSNG